MLVQGEFGGLWGQHVVSASILLAGTWTLGCFYQQGWLSAQLKLGLLFLIDEGRVGNTAPNRFLHQHLLRSHQVIATIWNQRIRIQALTRTLNWFFSQTLDFKEREARWRRVRADSSGETHWLNPDCHWLMTSCCAVEPLWHSDASL